MDNHMSATGEQIEKMATLTQQNVALVEMNKELSKNIKFTADSEYASGKRAVVDAINFGGGNATTDMSLSQLASELKRIVNKNIPLNSKWGYIELNDEVVLRSAIDLLHVFKTRKVKKFVDRASTVIVLDTKVLGCFGSYCISYENATTVTINGNFSRLSHILELYLPKYAGTPITYILNSSLQVLHIPLVKSCNWKTNITKLIDLKIGGGATTGTFNISKMTLSECISDGISLLSEQDLADGFTSNKEKWLWNLRNHFAALLGETTDGQIIFHATPYAALDEETITAFTSKGWTVASA